MTLTLELTPKQEQQLRDEAESRGMDAAGYAKARLFNDTALDENAAEALAPLGPLPPANGTGADLVAYWKRARINRHTARHRRQSGACQSDSGQSRKA